MSFVPATRSDPAPPEAGEFAPFYGGYIGRVEGDLWEVLRRQPDNLDALLDGLDEEAAGTRYAPGKWSIRQTVGHLGDTERVMAYRALRFSRGDATPLPGFDQDQYVDAAHFDDRPLRALLADFRAARAATLAMCENMSREELGRRGSANGAEITVRAILYVLAGHPLHHMQILRDRYLPLIAQDVRA